MSEAALRVQRGGRAGSAGAGGCQGPPVRGSGVWVLILMTTTASVRFKVWCKNKCALRAAEGAARCLLACLAVREQGTW